MVEAAERERFAAEALARRVVGQRAGGQDLQRDVAVEPLVVGAIDDAHAAFADLLEDAVVAEGLADHGWR